MPIPQKPAKEPPKTAKERVYTELRTWIIDGTLKPEERISDQEISRYFSVSRTPVREALQLLSEQRLVDIYPGRETKVSLINLESINSIYRIAAELHALALEFAWPKITPEIIDELKKYSDGFSHSVELKDNPEASRYDQLFHSVFIRLADDHFLREFIKSLEGHILRVQLNSSLRFNLVGKNQLSCREHEEIIAALENQDLTAAKDAMRRNWISTIELANQE